MSDIGLPEIVSRLADETKISQKTVHSIISAFLSEVEAVLAYDDFAVALHGFGKFWISETPAHAARNPRTGEPVHVPARRRVRFSPSKMMTKRILDAPASVQTTSRPTIVYRKQPISKP